MGLLLLAQPLLRRLLDRPLPSGAPVAHEAEVDLWVGDLAPGVKGILGNVYDEPEADARNDREWNAALGVPEGEPLAYYRLHVANTSSAPVRVDLRDGLLTLTPSGGGPALPLRSLAPLLAKDSRAPALRANLAAVGSGREALEVPPGTFATPYVAFPRRVALGDVAAVARADGSSFHRRRIARERWEDLRASPTAKAVEEL
jgi:hypothetical protein